MFARRMGVGVKCGVSLVDSISRCKFICTSSPALPGGRLGLLKLSSRDTYCVRARSELLKLQKSDDLGLRFVGFTHKTHTAN